MTATIIYCPFYAADGLVSASRASSSQTLHCLHISESFLVFQFAANSC